MNRWIIICKFRESVIPITDNDYHLKVYKSLDAAKKFSEKNSLCLASEVLLINIETGQIEVV